MALELAWLGGDSHHPISVELGRLGFDFDSVGVGVKRGVWLDVARGVSLLYGEVDLVSISCVGVSICDSVGGALGARHLRFGGWGVCGSVLASCW